MATPTYIVKDILAARDHMSQRELAELMGTSQGVVSTMLRRDHGLGMQVRTLLRFAEALGYQVMLVSEENPDEDEEYIVTEY